MEKKKQRLDNTAETQEPVGKAAEEDSNSSAKAPAAEAPAAVPAPAEADGAGAASMDVATSADETAQGSSADEASETYVPCHSQRHVHLCVCSPPVDPRRSRTQCVGRGGGRPARHAQSSW